MPIRLVPLDDASILPTIIVDRPILLVGRHPECDVQIRSSKVSRRHCCLSEVDPEVAGKACLAVRDLDSTNGTRINGEVVSEGRLLEGDELTIGAYRFQVKTQSSVNGARDVMVSTEFPIPLLEPPNDHVLGGQSGVQTQPTVAPGRAKQSPEK
jgi:pSer/pThr/pTyr-binding forkhead associated (FHA) protein